MIMFILKKLVSRFFFPLTLVLELLLLGIFLKKKRTEVILAGVAILYLFFFLSLRLCHFAPSGKPICTHFIVQFE